MPQFIQYSFNRTATFGKLFALLLLCSLAVACTQAAPTVFPTPPPLTDIITPTQTASPIPAPETLTATPLPTAAPTDTQTPTPIPTPTTAPISDAGPWFVYYCERESAYFVVNENGSGKSAILSNVTGWSQVVGSPNNLLAIIAEWPTLEKEYPENLALVILSLPDGKVKQTIPLLSYPDIPPEYLTAIGSAITYASAAWSPNGRYLAFIGAIDGPTADLYLYDSVEGQSIHLSAEPNRASHPQWSPDGKWIVYNESENIWGMCDSLAVWAATVDTGKARKLFAGECNPDILAWVGMKSFISIDHTNGPTMNLNAVNLENGLVVALLPEQTGLWTFADFGEPIGINLERQEIAYSVTDIGLSGAEIEGTYIFSFDDPAPRRLSAAKFWTAQWMSGIGRYVAYPDTNRCGLVTFTSNGEFNCLQDEEYAFVTPQGDGSFSLHAYDLSISPDGEQLVILSDTGLYLYNSKEMQPIPMKGENGRMVAWMPDSGGFVFADDTSLYSVKLLPLNVQKVRPINNLFPIDIFWNSAVTGFFVFADDSLDYFSFIDNQITHINDVHQPIYSWVGK